MSKWKSLFLFLLCIALLLPTLTLQGFADTRQEVAIPSVSAQSAVLIEAESGSTVFAKNASTPLPMASTTKIMTAWTALELASPDTVITVDAEAVGVEGSSVYLVENEQLTLEQLLYALLLESANDAAAAIAIALCGSIEAFAAEMNRRATDLGLEQTHFENPHGLDSEGHYTTAYELALITQAALRHPLVKEIVSTKKTTIPHASEDCTRLLVNHNKLLRQYDGCIGVKTGFTKRSGRCLVSAAERDGVTLIAVTLNAPDDWDDHASMLDYGFTKFESVLLCEEEDYLLPCSVVGGADSYVMLCNEGELRVTLPTGHGSIRQTVEMPRFLYAPVAEGDLPGQVVFYCDTNGDGVEERIGTVKLRACYTVPQKRARRSFWSWLKGLLGL